ncbi:helix-turn-helix domain-containing protein [Naasia lichenicola]|uniref:Helix-turn-helix transcriptional regulator n=1 Tax=Naasia lichenicola TaxID=2565933 RepID=A0A4S4FT04_9MICO|nr:helix-turn-helix domain-containing protein [Naasia lichenicola]THG32865.1 helix-turn-helix transcriptional regulator [Naasia lichenicola]
MTQLPMPGLGSRIHHYRKLNRWSAQQLANHTGGEVSRSIIASIESGRREDLTVRQFMAICFALQIPPAALLVDLEKPFERQPEDRGGTPYASGSTAAAVTHWLHGQANITPRLPSSVRVDQVLRLVDAYLDDLDTLAIANVRGRLIHLRTKSGEDTREELRLLENRLRMTIGMLHNAGIEVPDHGNN